MVVIKQARTEAIDSALATVYDDLARRDAVERLWRNDHTLWSDDPTEIADRLGWTDVFHEVAGQVPDLEAVGDELVRDGFTHALVMGMGGSSLFPEVLASSYPTGEGRGLRLSVLDSTSPAAIRRVEAQLPLDQTLFIAASKSGGTIETRSHLEHFWSSVGRGEQFVAITDPGSELATLGRERGFRHVFENRTDIGGRYSALSYFGLVPGALAGIDLDPLLDTAIFSSPRYRSPDPDDNAALVLGAAMAAGVAAGRDKVTFVIDERIATFGLWLEQLIAESTGKEGTGVVPVVDERVGDPDVYGSDRLFVAIGDHSHGAAIGVLAEAGHPVIEVEVQDVADLGALVVCWEAATALCGAALGVNPFDQPNVAEAKAATATVLDTPADERPRIDETDDTALAAWLDEARPGDYLAVQLYCDPEAEMVGQAEGVRAALRDRLGIATTVGIGPRFLHSTGQLHKGGPRSGRFIQVVDPGEDDVAIPGRQFSFGDLIRAQADGDLATLQAHDLPVVRVDLDTLTAASRA